MTPPPILPAIGELAGVVGAQQQQQFAMDPSMYQQQQQRKPLNIVDPASGKTIAAPSYPAQAPPINMVPAVAKRAPLKIVDPNNGTVIELLGLNFQKREESKPLEIVNPTTHAPIKI